MKRLFLIIITSLLLFSTASYLFSHQRLNYTVSFQYFLDTVSLLDIDFESIRNFFSFIRDWLSSYHNILNNWWNPLYWFTYLFDLIEQFLRFVLYFIGDIFEFFSSIFYVLDRLLFFA